VNKCILCKSELSESTAPEHILLNALGGRKTTKSVICSKCNNSMGNGPDKDLADSVAPIRNIGNFISGKSSPPPTLKNIAHDESDEKVRYNLEAGSVPIFDAKQPMNITESADGTDLITIYARDEKQLNKLVEATIIRQKLSLEQAEKLRQQAKVNAVTHSFPSPTFKHEIQFGSGESQRAIAKACLVLWADKVGNWEALNVRYDDIRKYINGDPVSAKSDKLLSIDTRPLPEDASNFYPNPNIVWVGSNNNGQVIGYFRLFGAIGWSVRICDEGAPENISTGLISNPENPKEWEDDDSASDLLEYEWVASDHGTRDYVAVNSSINRLISRAYERSRSKAFDDEIEKALKDAGIDNEESLSEEKFIEFTHRLAWRITCLLRGLPHKKSGL
jgi:HNH endonuclease